MNYRWQFKPRSSAQPIALLTLWRHFSREGPHNNSLFRGTKERFIRVLTLKKLYKYSSESKSDDEDGSDGEDAEGKDKTEGE